MNPADCCRPSAAKFEPADDAELPEVQGSKRHSPRALPVAMFTDVAELALRRIDVTYPSTGPGVSNGFLQWQRYVTTRFGADRCTLNGTKLRGIR